MNFSRKIITKYLELANYQNTPTITSDQHKIHTISNLSGWISFKIGYNLEQNPYNLKSKWLDLLQNWIQSRTVTYHHIQQLGFKTKVGNAN